MNFQSIEEIIEKLDRKDDLSSRDLYNVWEQRQPVPEEQKSSGPLRGGTKQIPWVQESLKLARKFTHVALEKEEFLLVCDAASEILRHYHDLDEEEVRRALVHIRVNYAAALMRLGFTRDARGTLEPCAADHFQPKLGPELRARILLQLGDTLREEYFHLSADAARMQAAREGLEFYHRSLKLDPEHFEALSRVAASSLIIGDRPQAHEKAIRILSLAKAIENSEGLTLSAARARAVAHAVLGHIDEAKAAYQALQNLGEVETKDLAEARFYAQFLAESLDQPRNLFHDAFPPLELIIFAGHLPDLPGAPSRFPESKLPGARKAIADKLVELKARVGLVSMAAGGDLLFADEMLKRPEGALHVVLPWSQEEFRNTSVVPYEHPEAPKRWNDIFTRALEKAATIRAIGQTYAPASGVGWQYIMEVTAGLALHTARVSRLDVRALALWDGRPGRGAGGTSDFAEFWAYQLGREPDIIPLEPQPIRLKDNKPRRCERPMIHQQVKSMLFADIVGYSKLTETVIPEFIGVFLERVSRLASESRHAPRSVNTWGDAVYAIFDFAYDAGCFALELAEMILEGREDWITNKLYSVDGIDEDGEPIQRPLNVRIGLHTGPVFMHYDPVVRRLGFTGEHVNRAARIEPIAKPGEVFASEEFAALAELGSEIRRRAANSPGQGENNGFVCEYAGSRALAKNFPGRFRIYRVLPKRAFVIERLAQTAHDSYYHQALRRGDRPDTNSSLREWDKLPEDLKDSNRAQVADIPIKLRLLGYELAPGHGLRASKINMSPEQITQLAMHEHDRWMADRIRHGWTHGKVRDNDAKKHPCLVPWDELNETEKEKDRDAVRNMPLLIEQAGFRVRKLPESK